MMKWVANKGTVQVDPKSLMLDCLNAIYNDDASIQKDKANRTLTYIHLVSQIDDKAPYFRASVLEVRSLAKKQIYKDADLQFPPEVDSFLESCIAEYQHAYEEAGARAARIFRKKVDEVLNTIDNTILQIKETNIRGVTNFTSNFPILSKMMNEVKPMISIQEELEAMVKKNDKTAAKVRGDKKQSILTKRLQAHEQATEEESSDAS